MCKAWAARKVTTDGSHPRGRNTRQMRDSGGHRIWIMAKIFIETIKAIVSWTMDAICLPSAEPGRLVKWGTVWWLGIFQTCRLKMVSYNYWYLKLRSLLPPQPEKTHQDTEHLPSEQEATGIPFLMGGQVFAPFPLWKCQFRLLFF